MVVLTIPDLFENEYKNTDEFWQEEEDIRAFLERFEKVEVQVDTE